MLNIWLIVSASLVGLTIEINKPFNHIILRCFTKIFWKKVLSQTTCLIKTPKHFNFSISLNIFWEKVSTLVDPPIKSTVVCHWKTLDHIGQCNTHLLYYSANPITASKAGSDGHIQVNVGCSHWIQSWVPNTKWITVWFNLGGQMPGPLTLNWTAIH
jgi:hypothetical protein